MHVKRLLFQQLECANLWLIIFSPLVESTECVDCGIKIAVAFIGNESVPIQLAQCWFFGLTVSNAKI